MPVAFRAASDSGNAANASSHATAVPVGVQIDDVVVAFLETWNGAVTVTPPSGFAQKGSVWSSGDGQAQNSVWWKRLTAADSGNYTFGLSGSRWTTLQCMAFSGVVGSGDPFDAVATPVTGTFGSITSMSVTMTDAGGALVFSVYNDTNGTHTPPTNFTETADVDSAAMAYWIPGSAGSQSASGASISSSSAAGAWLGALLSDGGGIEVVRPRRLVWPGRGPTRIRISRRPTAAEVAPVAAAQTGSGAAGLTATAAATKVAVASGAAAAGLAGAATAAKVAAQGGSCALGTAGRAAASKVAAARGPAAAGLAAQGAASKVTASRGVSTLGPAGVATERKVAPDTGSAALGLAATGLAAKVAVSRGAATVGLAATRSELAIRAQGGACALGALAGVTARKVAATAATAALGVSGTALERRSATGAGSACLGAVVSSLPRKRAVAVGTDGLGLATASAGRKVVAGHGSTALALIGTGEIQPPIEVGSMRAGDRRAAEMTTPMRAGPAMTHPVRDGPTMRKG